MMLTKVQRPALGVLAAVAVTLGMLAAPVADIAQAESVSANLGVAHQCTAPDASITRSSGEEIPQTVGVAERCPIPAVASSGTPIEGGDMGDGSKPGGAGDGRDGGRGGLGGEVSR